MKRALWIQIARFAAVFFPLHVLPPILSDGGFLPGAVDDLRQIVGLAYHLGFMAGAALVLALGGPRFIRWLGASRRWLTLGLMATIVATLEAHPLVQVLARLAYGVGASLLLALFYRDFALSYRYDRMPEVFGYAAILLESGGLAVGLVVAQYGSTTAMALATALTVAALFAGDYLSRGAEDSSTGSRPDSEGAAEGSGGARAGIRLFGPRIYMVTAMLAYAGFFLMLLTLGNLRGLDHGAVTSGLAIFSTAFAFSAGNLVRFERWALLAHPVNLVSLGVAVSLTGSLLAWSSMVTLESTGIVVGAMLVAFGNGITVSRCFQRASIASPDGYTGPLLTMAGVMVLTVGLSAAGRWLGGSAPMIQCLAFATALATLLLGGLHADRRAHL